MDILDKPLAKTIAALAVMLLWSCGSSDSTTAEESGGSKESSSVAEAQTLEEWADSSCGML